jgi:glutamate racemase
MGKVAVFDSGLGSLSIVLAIRKATKADIVYFADQKNYPYGKKSYRELRKIIESSIEMLQEKFQPDVIVVGSNTPTLLFPDLFENNEAIVGVLPPLEEAVKKTKTRSIAVLGTTATVHSRKLNHSIKQLSQKNISMTKIDATDLIDLVESGKFLSSPNYCETKIQKSLFKKFSSNNIDVATLSSTHLPFLNDILSKLFPRILFLDPANYVAQRIALRKDFKASKRNSLKIFSSGDLNKLQNTLYKLKIKKKISHLDIF